MKLSELKTGKKGIVVCFPEDDLLSRRLVSMGYSEGTEVVILLENKDMLELQIGKKLIGVKKSQCGRILVKEAYNDL